VSILNVFATLNRLGVFMWTVWFYLYCTVSLGTIQRARLYRRVAHMIYVTALAGTSCQQINMITCICQMPMKTWLSTSQNWQKCTILTSIKLTIFCGEVETSSNTCITTLCTWNCKFKYKKPSYQVVEMCAENALKLTIRAAVLQKIFPGAQPRTPSGRGTPPAPSPRRPSFPPNA
jgi:hypothetical protein